LRDIILVIYARFEVLMVVTMKNVIFWDVTLVRTDVSDELSFPSSGWNE
jgi:hypothetical protein